MRTDESYCPKKLGCKLWQVICDGEPCIVEAEIGKNDSRGNAWSGK